MKDNDVKACIALNPDTDIARVYEYLPYVHMVLIMSVVPGKGGQTYIKESTEKIRKLRKYCDENNLDIDIEVDGGINNDTGREAFEAGANILVSGNYVLKADDYKEAINSLKKI